jgi:uncharacterized membrane protein
MRSFLAFLRTTFVGGAFFLLPFVLALWLLGRALAAAAKALKPVADALPIEDVVGVAVGDIIAALALVAICFLAGLLVRTGHGRKLAQAVEQVILNKVPGYTLLKSMTRDDDTLGSGGRVVTALARVEDAWALAFIMERHDDGLLTVFVPSAPTPAVGAIYYLTEDRVRRLGLPVHVAAQLIMRLGVGSAELLRGKLEPVVRP